MYTIQVDTDTDNKAILLVSVPYQEDVHEEKTRALSLQVTPQSPNHYISGKQNWSFVSAYARGELIGQISVIWVCREMI